MVDRCDKAKQVICNQTTPTYSMTGKNKIKIKFEGNKLTSNYFYMTWENTQKPENLPWVSLNWRIKNASQMVNGSKNFSNENLILLVNFVSMSRTSLTVPEIWYRAVKQKFTHIKKFKEKCHCNGNQWQDNEYNYVKQITLKIVGETIS